MTRLRAARFGAAGPLFRAARFGAASHCLRWAGARHAIRIVAIVLGFGALAASDAQAQDLPSGPVSLANGRVTIGADISLSATAQGDDDGAWFNYTDYEHNTLRMTRLGATADIRAVDRVSLLAEIRSENGDAVRPYALFVRVRPLKNRPIDIQAGRIPPTFGAFSRRNYAGGNPVIGYPLAYQYLTALRADAIPADAVELMRMRARGWRPSYTIGAQALGTGMPLITAFRWDTGVEARVGTDRFMVAAAVTNGTLSDPHTRDNNHGKQLSGRVQWRPTAGISVGGSAARGRYLSDAITIATVQVGDKRSMQRAFGLDAEYSRDHWLVRGEAVWDQWQVPTFADAMTTSSAFLEGTYKLLPGFFVAGRIDRLSFGHLAAPFENRTWDAPVTRLEAGAGFYIRRNLVAKSTYQHNWRDGGLVRSRGLLVVQLQFWL